MEIDTTNLEQLPGVGKGTSEKMKEGGVLTILSVATSTPSQLKDSAGVTESTARKMINAARDLCKLGFETGTDIDRKIKETKYISTHCKTIDKLLGGGLRLGTTMEAFGQYASGKTQVAHILAVSAIKQFPDSYVVWVDSENTFSAKRIREFSKGLNINPELVLAHIRVGKCVSTDHQILLTESIEKEIVNGLDVKLVIIDSLMNHFRAEYLGRGALAGRQQMINGYLHKISKLVANYNLAFYMTNQVQVDPGMSFGNPEKAIGGNIISHFAGIRVWIVKAAKGTRRMKLVDSSDLPEGEADFIITENELEAVE